MAYSLRFGALCRYLCDMMIVKRYMMILIGRRLTTVTAVTAAMASAAVILSGCASSSHRIATVMDNVVESATTPSSFVPTSLKPSSIPRNASQIEDLRLDTEVCLTKAAITGSDRERKRYLRQARENVTTLQWVSPENHDVEFLNRRLSRLETSSLVTAARASKQ